MPDSHLRQIQSPAKISILTELCTFRCEFTTHISNQKTSDFASAFTFANSCAISHEKYFRRCEQGITKGVCWGDPRVGLGGKSEKLTHQIPKKRGPLMSHHGNFSIYKPWSHLVIGWLEVLLTLGQMTQHTQSRIWRG